MPNTAKTGRVLHAASDRMVSKTHNVGDEVIDIRGTLKLLVEGNTLQENRQLKIAQAVHAEREKYTDKILLDFLKDPAKEVELKTPGQLGLTDDDRAVINSRKLNLNQFMFAEASPEYLAKLVIYRSAAQKVKEAKAKNRGAFVVAQYEIEAEAAKANCVAAEQMFKRSMFAAFALRKLDARDLKLDDKRSGISLVAWYDPIDNKAETLDDDTNQPVRRIVSGNWLEKLGRNIVETIKNPPKAETPTQGTAETQAAKDGQDVKNGLTAEQRATVIEVKKQAIDNVTKEIANIADPAVKRATLPVIDRVFTQAIVTLFAKETKTAPRAIVLEEVNEAIRLLCKAEGIPVYNKFSETIGKDGKPVKADDTHMKELERLANAKPTPPAKPMSAKEAEQVKANGAKKAA